MTANFERATDVIYSHMSSWDDEIQAVSATQELSGEDLLKPDLPAPHEVDRYPGSACWEVCTDPSAAARRHVGVRVDHMHRIKTNITGEVTPDEAREAAYALLAAANHAE